MVTSWDDIGVEYSGDDNSGTSMLPDSDSSSTSDDSGAYDRYGTGAYDGNIGSGTARAADADQNDSTGGSPEASAEITTVEESTGQEIDHQDVTITTDEESGTVTSEYGLANGGVAEVTNQLPEGVPEMPEMPEDITGLDARTALAAVAALAIALVWGS